MFHIYFFLKILIKYHSKECQKNHWIYHKNDCRPVQLGVDDIIHLKKRENHSTGNCYEEIENLWKNITKSRVNNTDLLIHSHEAALLLYHAEQIQIQHERLEVEISAVIQSLTQSLRKLNVTLPEKKRVKNKSLSQLKSRENILSLVERCNSSDVQTQLESTKECRKLLSGKKKTKKKLKFFLIIFRIDHNPPIKELAEMGLVPVFVRFLTDDRNPKLQVFIFFQDFKNSFPIDFSFFFRGKFHF